MLFWVPDQNNALRFSGFQPEARLRATLGQDAPHGLGVSDPSPCAPPRQAGRPGPIGHSVVGSRQRKFGFPTKLPGRKRPSSGDFSDLRSEARLRPRRPLSLPHGLGVSDPSPCAPPRQAGRPGPIGHSVEGSRQRKFGFPTKLPGRKRPSSGDFSDLRSEARLRPRRPLSLPHGLGVSDPSPCAPPRQADRPSPIGHSVVGFCGAARGE